MRRTPYLLLVMSLLASMTLLSCGREEPEEQKKPEDFDVNEWENTDIDGDATMSSSSVMSFSMSNSEIAEHSGTNRSSTTYAGICTLETNDLIAVGVTRSGESEVIKLYKLKSDGFLEYAGSDNEPFIWRSQDEMVSIRAWSYGTSTQTANTLTAPESYDYSLETDQQSNGYQELLYCKTMSKKCSDGTITFTFYHQLARVVFNVDHERTGVLSVTSSSVGNTTFPISARFSVPTGSSNVGSWSVKTTKGSITPKTETTQSGFQKTYSAVVFPGVNYAKDTDFFTITNGDGNYVYSIPNTGGVTLTAANQYHFTTSCGDKCLK